MRAEQDYAEYLGDGVYASYDGWHIWLDLRGQGDGHIRIAMEPSVLAAFDRYRADLKLTLEGEKRERQVD